MLKCIAIDDEPIALNIIESYCQQHGEIQLETFTSPQEGMNRIKEISPDIVFMDIEMTGYSGIELAKELPADSALIFTTAYANYALEGFDVDAVDFLHKPMEVELRLGSLNSAVDEVISFLLPEAEEKGITVEEKLDSFIPPHQTKT